MPSLAPQLQTCGVEIKTPRTKNTRKRPASQTDAVRRLCSSPAESKVSAYPPRPWGLPDAAQPARMASNFRLRGYGGPSKSRSGISPWRVSRKRPFSLLLKYYLYSNSLIRRFRPGILENRCLDAKGGWLFCATANRTFFWPKVVETNLDQHPKPSVLASHVDGRPLGAASKIGHGGYMIKWCSSRDEPVSITTSPGGLWTFQKLSRLEGHWLYQTHLNRDASTRVSQVRGLAHLAMAWVSEYSDFPRYHAGGNTDAGIETDYCDFIRDF